MKKVLPLLYTIALCTALDGQIVTTVDGVFVTNERFVNSGELEFSPVFYKEGIVFISTRHESVKFNVKDQNIGGKNIMSIYRATRNEEGFLQTAEPFADELISKLHEGPVAFDKTADLIFFTRNESLETAPDGFKKLQVFSARKQGDIWQDIQKLPFNNINFNYSHPAISVDNDVLFVASDMPGGFGGMDLYAVYPHDGRWTDMVNLGEKVNTPGNEVFPYIAADGTLYFASDGLTGMGNLDLFYTTQNPATEQWNYPVNLGAPFNSPSDDFGFIVDRDNKNGYFSSDRPGGYSGDDIYSFHIEGEASPMALGSGRSLDNLVVRDKNGMPISGAVIKAIALNDVSLAAGDDKVVKLLPGDDGTFILDVNANDFGKTAETDQDGKTDLRLNRGSYVLKIGKDGYATKYVVVAPETNLNTLDLTLQRAEDCVTLTGQVFSENGRTPVSGASVQIVDIKSNGMSTVYTDEAGQFEYCAGCFKIFTVYAQKNGASSTPAIASTKDLPCGTTQKIKLLLNISGPSLFAGMTIRLPNIYFNFDDAALRPDAYRDLDELSTMLKAYPNMELELASHTDSRGGAAYNLDLSQRRSISVFNYLSRNGVSTNRLTPRGYGESQVRNRCVDGISCTESEHQYNRRTEVKILSLGEPATSLPGAIAVQNPQNPNLDDELEPASGKGGQDVGVNDAVFNENTSIPDASIAGTYTVVAGTFANHDYALRRAELLKNLGYSGTNIVTQSRNGLYAVWVKTFTERNEAAALVRQLAQQQLSAYVMTK